MVQGSGPIQPFQNACPSCSSERFVWKGKEPSEIAELTELVAQENKKMGGGAQAALVIGGLVFMFLALPMGGLAAFLLPLGLVVFVSMNSRNDKTIAKYQARIFELKENAKRDAESWLCERCGHEWRMQRP